MSDAGHLAVCLNPVLQRTLGFPLLRPGSVNRTRESRIDASGKGINVARVLTQLGAPATQLTAAGGRFRELFLDLARQDSIVVDWVESGSEIRWCTTLVERTSRTTTELVEESVPVAPGTEAEVRAAFLRLLPHHHTVILSGTKAPGYSAGLYPDFVAMARAGGKRVIIDVAGTDLMGCLAAEPRVAEPNRVARPNYVAKPNCEEFVATYFPDRAGLDLEHPATESAVRERMLALSRDSGAAIVLTRGAQPTLVVADGEQWQEAPEPIEPLNTTGSGDAFTAALAHALALGHGLRAAVAAGHRAGAANAVRLRPGVIA